MTQTTMVEPRAQRWRALVQYQDGQEGLLCLGSSHVQVRENYYKEPWQEILTEEERSRVKNILLQKWIGAPDRGKWLTQLTLSVPITIGKSTLAPTTISN